MSLNRVLLTGVVNFRSNKKTDGPIKRFGKIIIVRYFQIHSHRLQLLNPRG